MAYHIETNRLMERIRGGETALGFQIRSRSPLIAELAGYLGFDFLYIETEHFACNDESIEEMIRAAQLSDITPLVRITQSDPEIITHILDMGAKGIIMPHLETAEQARKFVDAGKFPPLGHRGASTSSRAAQFGLCPDDLFLQKSNQNCLMIGMIETIEGIKNIEEILAQGIDLIRIGRRDLSLDMRCKENDPRFIDAMKHVIATADKKGVAVGTNAKNIENALYYKEIGFKHLTLVSDLEHITKTVSQLLSSAREVLK